MKLTRDTQYIREVYLKKDQISSYDHFPFTLPIIRNLEELIFHPNVTYIIGENGMGKSTLLEGIAIALGFNPEGGTLNFHFSNYDSHSNLDHYLRLVKGVNRAEDSFFFRAETFYNVATNIEELDKEPGLGGKIMIPLEENRYTSNLMGNLFLQHLPNDFEVMVYTFWMSLKQPCHH
jgi:predicted ATPase